jgi:transcription antitermination factor NusG
LFCRFDIGENFTYVRWTRGVKKLFPVNVNPISVENEVVEAIRSLEQKDGVIRKQPLKKNGRIRIARGPLKDVLGIFEHCASDRKGVRHYLLSLLIRYL